MNVPSRNLVQTDQDRNLIWRICLFSLLSVEKSDTFLFLPHLLRMRHWKAKNKFCHEASEGLPLSLRKQNEKQAILSMIWHPF